MWQHKPLGSGFAATSLTIQTNYEEIVCAISLFDVPRANNDLIIKPN